MQYLLQSFQALLDEINALLRRFDPCFRFLLEGMDHQQIMINLNRIHHPKGIALFRSQLLRHICCRVSATHQ